MRFPITSVSLINDVFRPTGKHGSYNKFEVTPPPQQQQDYDERKQQNEQRGADQGGYGPRKQVCFHLYFTLAVSFISNVVQFHYIHIKMVETFINTFLR
jgi:hypothetical protein